jgi:hypothetical protein
MPHSNGRLIAPLPITLLVKKLVRNALAYSALTKKSLFTTLTQKLVFLFRQFFQQNQFRQDFEMLKLQRENANLNIINMIFKKICQLFSPIQSAEPT